MHTRSITLDQVRGRTLEDVAREVLDQHETLTIQMSESEGVTILPSNALQPLPVLEGQLPEGWEEAIYE